jgi:uncharacterized protein (TIGR00251 family)
MSFYTINDDTITINIKAQPNSSKNKFASLYGENAIKVNIKAPAVEGAANKELIKFISKSFKIAKNEIKIKGETSKQKQLIVPKNQKIIQFLESFLEDHKNL